MGRRSFRSEQQQFVVEGPVVVREALEHASAVREIYVRRDECDHIADMCAALGREVPIFVLDDKTFDSVSDVVTPRGVIAVCDRSEPVALAAVGEWVLVAHEVADPGNIGTLMRSAEASGATAFVVSGESADPFSPKAVRSSAGAVFHVPVVEIDSLDRLGEAGFVVVGTTSHRRSPSDGTVVPSMYDTDFIGRVAVVLGNEAHGLDAKAPVDRWVTVPHHGRSESLNVAMAGTTLAMHIAHVRTSG